MTEIMLAWGSFQFSADTAEYQELERKHSWRWVTYDRVNSKSALQFQGFNPSEIPLKGVIYCDSAADVKLIDSIKAEGDKGTPLRLISGSSALGRDWGLWCLAELEEKQTHLLPDGTPLKQEFSCRFVEYGSDNY